MNTSSAGFNLRTAALSLAVALAVAACGGNDGAPAAGSGNASPDAATGSGEKVAAQITGAGATFIFPLITKWSADYNAATGNQVNYQSIGSGGGIAQIKAGTVDFGSSDAPLSSEELAEAGLLQFPSVIGGVVPVVNVAGIEAGELKLTGPLLADIYLGKVKAWNDPAIAAINPGLELPATKINLVQRSDGSGTTFNFTNYLTKVSPAWKEAVGEGKSVQWPDGVGGKGNEGVASYVQQIDGSIGYVELAYALQNNMAYAMMQNAAGNFVAPSAEAFAAAAATADWTSVQDFNLVITNAPGEQAWPITATNFILMYEQPADPERSAAAREFFTWALENGQQQAAELDYVPLPPELVGQIERYWAAEFKGAAAQ
jgi:phosphate transport system substrate-binding protein